MNEFLDGGDRGDKEWHLILGLRFQQGRHVAVAGGVAFWRPCITWEGLWGFKRLESFPMGWDPGLIKKGGTSCVPAHSSLSFPTLAAMWPAASSYVIKRSGSDGPLERQTTTKPPSLKFLMSRIWSHQQQNSRTTSVTFMGEMHHETHFKV